MPPLSPSSGPTQIRSSLVGIMTSIAGQLATALDWDASRIKQVARPFAAVPALDGDQDLVLQWGGFRGDRGHESRADFRIYRRLRVTLRTRSEWDEVSSDVLWLRAEIVGEEQLLDALENFWPLDADGNGLTFEPVVVTEGGDYERPTKDRGWGQVTLTVEVGVQPPLTLSEPGLGP